MVNSQITFLKRKKVSYQPFICWIIEALFFSFQIQVITHFFSYWYQNTNTFVLFCTFWSNEPNHDFTFPRLKKLDSMKSYTILLRFWKLRIFYVFNAKFPNQKKHTCGHFAPSSQLSQRQSKVHFDVLLFCGTIENWDILKVGWP